MSYDIDAEEVAI
jgi:pyruvyltransferase